ncbi:Luciferin 4-monooxygenase [Cryptotermes secundus]|uniref:Luciferin 4-monooxygenase n=2 Tax=Cryptotermes secundus TaxID=105785 RepID=A0A2J7QLX8_9NEOP|nr:Luciferin 4-monooxygenase [Cryptotermes secundus]PNF29546.1 Luciferin 4-monooxygenase [Cryptotermes secundus]PNF29547.1 Luciferin 4-monooxygenase [Cryptotermes secundus]PNF29548.1 Luciferin 4-monooxygenase [Cryptotermes secundus]PNF29549.1 Luciferin 4-monooxygenase [Cryptotermes secundus]
MASQHILSGPEISITVPDISVGRYLYQSLVRHGNAVAMVDAVTGETRTFSDILTRSLSVAECLRVRGVAIGDVVAICSENSLDFIVPVLATYYIGAICAPMNPNYTAHEMLHVINISKPRIIFCSGKALACVDEVSRHVGFLKEIVTFGLPMSHKHTPFVTFLRDKSCSFQPLDEHDMNLVAAILCSSGTTGLPKGVMLSQKNIISLLEYVSEPSINFIDNREVTLGLTPMFHAYGFMFMLLLATAGSKVVVMDRFEEHIFLRSIQNHKIKHLFLVPPLVVFLAKAEIVDKYDLSSVQRIYSGAAPLSEEIETLVKKRLGVDLVIQAYGLTETTLAVIGPTENENKKGTAGTLRPGVTCKVVDLETGRTLGPHKTGELRFKGPFIMKGYYGDPQATAASFDSDGFLLTGDVGYYDEDGFFYIVDRAKELIKYKGYQVPPAELEAVLLTHPAVKDAGVVGIPDEAAGELPLAFIVKQPGATLTKEEIIKYVADHVSPQKRLRGGVLFVESIPKTSSGKILRRELRIMLKSKM